MKQITLIYDQLEETNVKEKVIPAFDKSIVRPVPFRQHNPNCDDIEPESLVVTYLSDAQLAEIITTASEKKWTLGFLPHPDMKEAGEGYGVSGTLAEAVEDVLLTDKGTKADLLLCNGRPVFNKVVIGNSLSMMSGSVSKNTLLSKLEKSGSALTQSKSLVPRAFTITAENKPPVKTAALGIVAVLHGKSSLFSRTLLKGSFINDNRLHALVLAPKSVMQLIRFSFVSLFKNHNSLKLPSFIGHIKTRSVIISSPAPMDFSQDNNLMSAKEIELGISENKLLIIPGRYLAVDNQAGEPQDKFKIDKLPKGEAYLQELTAQPLSLIYHASTEEFKGLFSILRVNAKVSGSFLTLMVLSTLLATLGLFSNSSPVIIGAMILAPLMAPIISLSMGVLRQEKSLAFTSAKTIGYGLLVSYLAAVFVTLLMPLHDINEEITARIRPNLLDLGIAIVSGIAGAYAHAREEVAKTLAGVAIAVALVPPLAVSGIGLGWADWEVFTGALLLFMTNLAGIVLAGTVTFMLLGFSPFILAKKGLLVSLAIVIIVSLPLGYGSMAMVRNYNVTRSVNNLKIDNITIKHVAVVRERNPMTLSVTLVSDKPVDYNDIEKIKKAIASRIGQDVQLEVMVRLRR
ncbi:DUF389 domain-containing protein [Pontibacter silvestris]|uniref:DUF389 domain-containing protein n=1 Tax=Pontibacter silvestris TaxID=2305183 RepID=A0ABW4X0D3_9BACT|nr:DUF389 domain-containing protein [Pontibacter silvestris]MCC9135139.1 DUF389 domain-containing protein [Pontibacter silvestris]